MVLPAGLRTGLGEVLEYELRLGQDAEDIDDCPKLPLTTKV